jgi:Ion channel
VLLAHGALAHRAARPADSVDRRTSPRFLRAAVDDPAYPVFVLALVYGLRRGEIAALRWDDVDFSGGRIFVRASLVRVDRRLVRGPVKSAAGVRALPLVALSRAALVAARDRQAEQRTAAITVPVFLFLFAATYFMMEQSNPDNFNIDSLTRTDSLYFTVTVFATVGFGDIAATSQVARMVVIAQMILDLLVLGLVVKVFVGAVEIGRGVRTRQQPSESS